MASASPSTPEFPVEAVHNEVLDTFGPDCAIESAPSPSVQGVHHDDVVSAWMPPDASDEEDALAAGEFTMYAILIAARCEPKFVCTSQAASCKRWSPRMHQRALPCLLAQSARIALITNRI